MIKLTLQQLLRDSKLTFKHLLSAYGFARENRLWEGILNYKWMTKFFFVLAILFSVKLFTVCLGWIGGGIDTQVQLANLSNVVYGLSQYMDSLFLIGGLKYVILILVEVVIFHFVRRTLEVVTGNHVDSSFKTFVKAQKRMILVAFFSFGMETFYSILLKVGTGIAGLEIIEPAGVFLIQCFFLGFAIVDNYNEVFHMTIKQSFRYTRSYAGVALAIGVPVYIIMLLPVLGTVVGPVIGAIVATITMNELLLKDNQMDGFLKIKE